MSKSSKLAAMFAYAAGIHAMSEDLEGRILNDPATRDPFLRNNTGHRGSKPDSAKAIVKRRKANRAARRSRAINRKK